MLNKVLEAINLNNMIEKGDSVTCALSGGADSVALLLALLKLKDKLEIYVDACHVNHNLRGQEAKRDEYFCRELCKRLNVTLNVASIDVNSYAENENVSTEMAARTLRYEALQHFSKGKIATAHTLSDSLETALFNFSRGTGLKGICGIAPVRDNIIRPLINVTRSEIEKFLFENNQDYVNDSTNFQNIYSRNKIRNIAVPVFKELNPGLFNSFNKTSEILSCENDFMDECAKKALNEALNYDGSLDIEKLSKNHTAVLRRAVFNYFAKYDIKCDFKKVSLIAEILKAGGALELENENFAVAKQGKLYLKTPSLKEEEKEIDLKNPQNNEIIFLGKKVKIMPLNDKEKKFFVNSREKAFNYCIDCDRINSNVVLRSKRAGDKVRLSGRNITKSLKKLFNEAKLLPNQREEAIIFDCGGEIIFVEGFGCSESVKITDSTKHSVRILIEEKSEGL